MGDEVLEALKLCALTLGATQNNVQLMDDDDYIDHTVRLYGEFLKHIDNVVRKHS